MPETSPAKPRSMFRVLINAPITQVWQEITRTDAPIACFFNSQMHLSRGGLVPGSKMAMRSPNGKWTGVVGEIIECTPPTRFSHTFNFTQFDDPPCIVTYELRELSGKTEFTLIISDVAEGTRTHKQMTQGATLIVNTLKSVIETGRPSVGVRLLFVLFKLLAPLSSGKSRSEHWKVD